VITEYELYSDERILKPPGRQLLFIGGVICSDKGRSRLLHQLSTVRSQYDLRNEMKWGKVSQKYLEPYRAWVDVFFHDRFARFALLEIDLASEAWRFSRPRGAGRDGLLASAFYQFLLLSFGPLSETKRWWVYPDKGFFSKDRVLDQVEFLFNRTYKKAFGPKSSRVIRLARSLDSDRSDLVQLADVLLGAVTCLTLGVTPESDPKAHFVRHVETALKMSINTARNIPRISRRVWVPADQFFEKATDRPVAMPTDLI